MSTTKDEVTVEEQYFDVKFRSKRGKEPWRRAGLKTTLKEAAEKAEGWKSDYDVVVVIVTLQTREINQSLCKMARFGYK